MLNERPEMCVALGDGGSVVGTAEHPFLVYRAGRSDAQADADPVFLAMGLLRPGDQVVTSDGGATVEVELQP